MLSQALPPHGSSTFDDNWHVTIRNTFLDLEETCGSLVTARLRLSRSCGDLPSLAALKKDAPELPPAAAKDCSDEGDANSTLSPEGDTNSTLSPEGDANSTLSPISFFTQDSYHTGSSTPSPRSGSPADERQNLTNAARRRERRRRAAKAKDEGVEAPRRPLPNAHAGPHPVAGGDNGAGAARSEPTHARAAAEEDDGEVWLQHLWDGACSAEQILQATHDAVSSLSLMNVVDVLHAVGKCAEGDAAALGTDKRLLVLVSHLRRRVQGLNKPRLIARTVWGLGKVNARSDDSAHVLAQLGATCTANPALLVSFTTQELSNTLWGLARLGSVDPRCRCHSERLVLRIIAESGKRLPSLTAQCLANSLWAIGKLGVRGQSVVAFACSCLEEMCGQRHLSGFSAQGLANSLWACARLQLQAEVAGTFCCAVAQEVTAERLRGFLPQELSMTIWAVAKITGRGALRGGRGPAGNSSRPSRRSRSPPEVEAFIHAATKEAFSRLGQFSPQGLSNIGWALATMELTRHECVRSFLIATASKAMCDLHWYPPQAIANLCWALCRLGDAPEDGTVNMFASAVAVQAKSRMEEFEWQDLAGIVSAMNRAELVHLEEVHSFATELVWHAAKESSTEIGTQALLNMALSAARLGVEPEALRPLMQRIETLFQGGRESLNDIDRRQLSEVRMHCCQPSGWNDAAQLVRSGRDRKIVRQDVRQMNPMGSCSYSCTSGTLLNADGWSDNWNEQEESSMGYFVVGMNSHVGIGEEWSEQVWMPTVCWGEAVWSVPWAGAEGSPIVC